VSTIFPVENLSKSDRLRAIGGTPCDDLTRWWANARKEGNLTLKIGQKYYLGQEFRIPQNVSFKLLQGEVLTIIGRLIIPAIISLYLSLAVPALAQTNGIQVSVNDIGLQTLTYNGQSYLLAPAGGGNYFFSEVVFRTPDGTRKSYDWNSFRRGDAKRSYTTSPVAFQQTYRSGLRHSITVKLTYTILDSRTLKIDDAVTNNDSTDSLARFYMDWTFLPLQLPGTAKQFKGGIGIELGPLNKWGGYPVGFLSGTWGSLALWMGDYAGSDNLFSWYSKATDTQFNFIPQSYSNNAAGQMYETPIAPGATKIYTTYLRFGAPTDSAMSLAPEGFNLLRQAYPFIVNWPDRRPIARWMISEGSHNSATNPRGYLWDPTIHVSDQTNFNILILNKTSDIINRMNAMTPRPQGILMWDLEGQEFYQSFTYVGNPNELHNLAPEMDAVADQMFAKFRNAGYKVGITLRASTFRTGHTLPVPCTSATSSATHDIFIKTNAVYPYRGYVCSAPDTWKLAGTRLPNHQQIINNDNSIIDILEAKIAYAKQRWGVTMFYIDSTVYSDGSSFSFKIIRQLQKDFPDTLVIPENETLGMWGAAAPYNEARGGFFDTPQDAKDIYPQGFSILETINGVNFSDQAQHNRLVQSVKNGNVLLFDGWFDSATTTHILQIYRDAGVSNTRRPGRVGSAPRSPP
jgi:hypothetical protein